MLMEKRFFNAKEVSVYLGVSEEAIRKWAIRGNIPFVKLGKSLRFDMIKIDSWVKTRESPYTRREFN
jgi:excisionase family DNA binding protein